MSDARSAYVEDALRRLRTLLRFKDCYVADVRDVLEDLASREIADALGNDTLARKVHGEPSLVQLIETLEGQLETVRAQLGTKSHAETPQDSAPTDRTARAPRDRSECRKGHPLVRENLRVEKNGHRICRTCQREYMREYARKRARQTRSGVSA
ncbi:MAG: hypothetical protein A3E78_11885 [Alphaproteobacteria bacterium RIFCSPHIGHO2_12_FULL_63_12]|nr:MAG: hypothetical protein A3E78_11885 [Alphaproteobacteria bacterium RIFCSPHIGHO2_12_FULL_63_12]